MGLPQRMQLYDDVEQIRQRPLIVYVTSSRPGASSAMALDAIPEFQEQLGRLPNGTKKADILIVSNGGDPMVAWRMITLLRERVADVGVLVPQAAYSAATLLTLGADEILMHPNGNLGPVDPQIAVHQQGDKTVLQFGFEEMAGFLEFATKEVGLTEQEHRRPIFELICKEVGAVSVGIAARSSLLSLTMGEKLLRLHMRGESKAQRARSIAEALNKAFYHHGYPLGRQEAKEIGLPLTDPDEALESLMWRIWQDLEEDLKIRKPFSATSEMLASAEGSKLLAPVQQFNLPVNAPPQVLQQILQQMLPSAVVQISPVDFSLQGAVMESRRAASQQVTRGKLLGMRLADLSVRVQRMLTFTGWEAVSLP